MGRPISGTHSGALYYWARLKPRNYSGFTLVFLSHFLFLKGEHVAWRFH